MLQVYKTYYPHSFGGIEKCIESLCQNALKHAIQSEIISVADCKQIQSQFENGITKTYYPKTFEKFSCPVSISLLKNFKEKVKQVDLIHFHFPWPFADFLNLMNSVNKPYIITYHSDIIRQKMAMPLYFPLLNHFFSHAKAIIATSDNYVKSSPILKKYSNKVCVIPIGLDDQINNGNALCENTKPYFLFVGVLRQYKGLHFLVEAMKNVHHYDLIIAGDGPCRKELEALIHRLQLKNIFLIGSVTDDQKYNLYKHAYAVVVPSHLRNEAYCYALVEGLMFGKPLISTELNTGTSFVNQHGETGIVVPPANPKALHQAMTELFEHKIMAEKYGMNARERFLALFTADKMTDGYLNVYTQMT